jgi:predicted nuclease of restriction endonuclease-like RecB superfamily
MGSPLAPLLAEIFLQDFERKYLPAFKEMDVVYWKCYVDDSFVLLYPKVSARDTCYELSQCHPALKVTVEEEGLPTQEDIKKITRNIKNYYSNKNQLQRTKKMQKKKSKMHFQTRICCHFSMFLFNEHPISVLKLKSIGRILFLG